MDVEQWKLPKGYEKWIKPKGYIHLIGNSSINEVRQLLRDKSLLAKHSFTPLLFKTIRERRFKRVDFWGDKVIRSHTKINKEGRIESNAKLRPLHYAIHLDVCIYTCYSKYLEEKYMENLLDVDGLSDCITAYRRIERPDGKGKNSIDFAKEIFDEIRRRDECVAIGVDIKSFFSSLNHKKIKKSWARLLHKKSLPPDHFNVFKSITNFSYVNLDDLKDYRGHFDERKLAENRKLGIRAFYLNKKELRDAIQKGDLKVYKNNFKDEKGIQCGIPQGLPISAMLANLYLLEFDKALYELVMNSEIKGFYRRYSDDIVIICHPEHETRLLEFISKKIQEYELKISAEKTEKCYFKKSNIKGHVAYKSFNGDKQNKENSQHKFGYLGFEFDGQKILIKQKSISKFYRRMKSSIKTKAKHVEKLKKKTGLEKHSLFLRKTYRNFTGKGCKRKVIYGNRNFLEYDTKTKSFRYKQKTSKKKYWGNFIGHAYRASDFMKEPGIKRQLRNHMKILNETIDARLK